MATKTELYRFSEQASATIWAFTDGNEEVTYNGDTYVPASISRSEAEVKNEISKANINVQMSLNNEAGLRWLADNGEKIVTLTIFERDKGGVFNVVWKGRLASIAPGITDITLKMESIFTSLRRPGLRARYQRSCRHPLYGVKCGVDPEAYDVAGSVTAVNGKTLTIAAAATFADGYFLGGMLRAPDGTLSYIINHVGSSIVLQRLSYSLVENIGEGFPFDVIIYPGCPHTRQACNSKFNNLLNYGGFDFIPTKNPMGGSSIV
ncbi:putative structural protein [Sphingomonas phage Kharn]|uniref:Putative structural protein n=1 Tax=Sphingomonas phage Kharn TaxID=2686312 RepID=A0A6M3T8B4_9CAUD|nr:putative structural protein [Sphingomonas phage Kharn]QJD54518.1 putative structural protein [Sphingomonas phage Kharn]